MQHHGPVLQQYEGFLPYADSPCFREWTEGVLDDPEVLAWLETLPSGKAQPNLVYAAARWHGVPAPGPYSGLRRALLEDDGTIRATILSRATQTNEVGRLATLVPAFAQIAGDQPLALIEAGASAGLCLYPDRWGYRWLTDEGEHRAGPERPQLTCTVSGDGILPAVLPDIAWRGGLDLNPGDVTDDDQMAWLENLVWPEHHDRRATLRQAIAIAREEPPSLVTGDLLEKLPSLVESASRHGTVVVFHSAVIYYLAAPDRERFHDLMAGLVADGACHWVSNEGASVLPRLEAGRPGGPPEGKSGQFLLAVDGTPLAWTHGHGRTLTWL